MYKMFLLDFLLLLFKMFTALMVMIYSGLVL